MRPIVFAALAVALLVSIQASRAAAPKLDALYPAGGQRGQVVAPVVVIGKSDKWPVSTWCSDAKVKVECEELKNRLRVTIAPDAEVGVCLIRIVDAAGASEARPFVIGNVPEILEDGENENLEKPEVVEALPVTVNGRLERKGDSDFYRLELKAGQLLTAALDGYSLRSDIDPFLHLFDPGGNEIAVASDTHNLDPFLQYRVRESGEHHLQVFAIDHKASTSVGYSGGPAAVYRLLFTTNEAMRLGLPLAADRMESDGEKIAARSTVAGVISRPGEVDAYSFSARKGDRHEVRVEARRWRYLWDPVLTIHRPDGRLLREVDDSKSSADAEYEFTASDNGDYRVSIADRFRGGDAEHRYRLVIEDPRPGVSVTIDKDRFELGAGKSIELKLKLDRTHGHKAELKFDIDGLPEGVSCEATSTDGKAKTATLTLKASKEVAFANGPIRILFSEEGDEKIPVLYSFQTGESRGDYLVNEIPDLWLTVGKGRE